ncbi:alpha/beta fold hydrolase [Leptospira sp. GIMC2001]|uniref:alpha/beta fold hydrolase n=1 Tax=Leptospira sp. GIMC2001 TaxID=1513297 RepID=UPI00234BFEF9|nr:alpha/beta hydrolase [Leptospira sp. GIMC2001]WCL49304.1 alpha/beta hydrolase [Leptospira sp. GIMC2001]
MNWDLKEHYQSGLFASNSGQKVFYTSKGKGEKVVLLPGLMATSYSYRKVAAVLSEHYQAISLDWPGIGFSEPSIHPYSHRYLATVLAEFLEEIAGEEKVHLVCHEYAGSVAFLMLNQFPEKVKSLSMVSCFLKIKKYSFPLPIKLFRIPLIGFLFSYLFFPPVIRIMYNLFMQSFSRPMSKEVAQDYYQLLFEGDRKKYLVSMCKNFDRSSHAQRDMESGIKKTVGLRQIIIGADDRSENAKQTEYLMEITRLSSVHIVDAGHLSMEEAPLSLAKKIEPLLNSMSRNKNKKSLGNKPWISSQPK